MCDQLGERGINATVMSHDVKDEILAASAFRAGERAWQGVEQGVDAFALVEPTRQQTRRGGPGARGRGSGS
jgi:hypothetical protein